MKRLFLGLVLSIGLTFSVYGELPPYSYTVNGDNTINITGYGGAETVLVIPSEIIGKQVTSIGTCAFNDYCNLTSITIPNTVTNIGDGGFYSCGPANIYFKGNAPTIGINAFGKDPYVQIYYLPNTTGWDLTFGGRPTVIWSPKIVADNNFGIQPIQPTPRDPLAPLTQFGFNIQCENGIGTTVVVEACTNLSTSWYPVQTNLLTNDTVYFCDQNWSSNSVCFYRVKWVPTNQ